MVSDAIVILVFLSLPVHGGFFPLGKSNLPVFFTVKHFCSTIKSWPDRNGRQKRKRTVFNMKNFDVIAAALVIIGALNWGLAGVFHADLVAALFGMKFGETSALSAVVYGLVGIAGLYQALSWKSIQRRWHAVPASARA
jgi:uncharacterized membrane protein YuzA (DUF378 family)